MSSIAEYYHYKLTVSTCTILYNGWDINSHHVVLVCSPDMPENEATFAITQGGIADAKE